MKAYGEKLRAAVFCFEGQALAWYRWSDDQDPFRHWEGLKARLLDRFQPSQEGDLLEQLLAITQQGTSREYVAAFEILAAQLPETSERVMQGTFIKGLRHELRSTVRLMPPTGLGHTIRLAIMIDENKIDDTTRAGARPQPHGRG